MDLDDLQEYASTLGIQSTRKFSDRVELIRTIQLASGHEACFHSSPVCVFPNARCEWESECINVIDTAAKIQPGKHAYAGLRGSR